VIALANIDRPSWVEAGRGPHCDPRRPADGYLLIMRRLRCLAALVLALAACGQVEPVTMAISMPDCVYQGANTMRAGVVSVSLTLNGIDSASVVLGEIIDDHTYDELGEHLDTSSAIPTWLDPRLQLDLSTDDGVSGVSKMRFLSPGTYALVCVDESGPRPASPMTVLDG
jgi:hypothetical protein